MTVESLLREAYEAGIAEEETADEVIGRLLADQPVPMTDTDLRSLALSMAMRLRADETGPVADDVVTEAEKLHAFLVGPL